MVKIKNIKKIKTGKLITGKIIKVRIIIK